MEKMLAAALALLIGLLMTRVFKMLRLHLPDVTAFLIAGLIVGPHCLGRLGIEGIGFTTPAEVDNLSVITNAALGFIAFSIGNEFLLSQLKAIGKQAVIVGIFQALTATLFVDLALIGLHFAMPDKISIEATRCCPARGGPGVQPVKWLSLARPNKPKAWTSSSFCW